jgi:hypothetical protein
MYITNEMGVKYIMGNKDDWREHIKWVNTITQGLPNVTTLQDNHVIDADEAGTHLNA